MRNSMILLTLLCLNATIVEAQKAQSGLLPSGDAQLYYEVAGSGKTIMLIHDGILPSNVWDAQFYEFAKEYRVIRYDRRGYGRSSEAKGVYYHLTDLEAVFDHLAVEKATLIACSSGGALSIDFTLKHPEKVEAMVLVGAVVGGFRYSSHFTSRGGHLPAELKDETATLNYYTTEDPYVIYPENLKAREIAATIVREYPPRIIDYPTQPKVAVLPIKRLGEITIPVLILVGEFDLPDLHAVAGVFWAGIEGSRREIIPHAGHLIPLEQPELFNEAVLKF